MRELRDGVAIAAPPERVWSWLTRLADNYRDWHAAHISAEWVKGEPNTVGAVLQAIEHLGGRREVLRFELTSVDPPRRLAYRFRGPVALLLPGGSFRIAPAPAGACFTAAIAYRFGRTTEWLFRRRMAILAQHMREEGENLKRLVEAGG